MRAGTLQVQREPFRQELVEAPAERNIAELISKNTASSIARFGRFEKETLVRLRNIYSEGWHRLDNIILLRGLRGRAGVPLSADETIRLSTLKREVETAMHEMEDRLREFAPDAIRRAGSMGEAAGASEIDILTREVPRIGFPKFAIVNREAIEFYANYTLETTINYGEEALNAIKRRLDMAMVTGEAWAPVSRDVRRIILEKRGMAITGLHHKANRIVRTELVRAYAGGHTAYGQACDFVIGERHNVAAGACDECISLAGKEYLFREGERFEIVHPYCHCYPSYIFSKNLFTKEELEKLGVAVREVPVEPVWRDARNVAEATAFAEKNLIKSAGAVDYGRLDLRSVNLLNRTLNDLVGEHKVKPFFVGSSQSWKKLMRQLFPGQKIGRVTPRAIAATYRVARDPKMNAVTLNEGYWSKKNLGKLRESLKNSVKQGWFKDGAELQQMVHCITHEYGHLLDYEKRTAMGIYQKIKPSLRGRSLKEVIGGYAASDYEDEIWAELFAMYKAGILPKALSSIVAGVL